MHVFMRVQEKRALELERMKSKAEAACKKLERDLLAIKQQKVRPVSVKLGCVLWMLLPLPPPLFAHGAHVPSAPA